ncbi:hypothetical protein DOTSEDRAFT_53599 [Dothistroma septosporum NZE10]|uniref:Uncharacterized protein n=1 Tax=Dothistroma septosporum (strain NZE10 / CBS 128990) TaxID=675120 RepID=N1PM03_DOTSN|nr:hypothetical protein DOTSEDRAFT_53599 [Dothistroma septosporum NZE10]
MPDPPLPQNLQELSAWIARNGPYYNIDHPTADFPDVGNFMIIELEAALLTGIENIKTARERLRTVPGPHQAFVECADLAATSRSLVLSIDRSGIMDINRSTAMKLVISAKYQCSLSYQNVLTFLAIGTQKLTNETRKVKAAVSRYQREVQAKEMLMSMLQSSISSSPASALSNGDDDDWFVVSSETHKPASTPGVEREGSKSDTLAQEMLYEEIEVRLAAIPGSEKGELAGEEIGGLPGTRYEPEMRVVEEERARQGTIVVAMENGVTPC